MNKDQFDGKFDQLKGEIKKAWGKLTDDEVLLYNGKQDQFYGKVQEKYGIAKEAAEKQMQAFEKSCGCSSAEKPADKVA